ncbi:hypothetical protein ACTI_65430 [Actinoplanes sp. OR16]|uniref:hypothetical protein n=1 Tax=Actinoplanes sp. OR16 TaxID=946334 RepID=UPI000F719581|nr:hypothetical protein [Actinoplanes sp. OR16]BBH69858.1 hypothetical protein ACTI_65430 [Actinoplanes sp. OR16]
MSGSVGALLLVRYCSWHAADAAELMSRAAVLDRPGSLRHDAEEWLRCHGPSVAFDHVSLIHEVAVLLEDPGDPEALGDCLRRANQLAQAAVHRARSSGHGEWDATDFPAIEEQARRLSVTDPAQAMELSREFARLYADVLEK